MRFEDRFTSLYWKFADRFGVDQANAIFDAALMHAAPDHPRDVLENFVDLAVMAAGGQPRLSAHIDFGSDAFRWAIIIVIGYQCVERYADDHGITISWRDFREWVRANAHIEDHDGDWDELARLSGAYDDFM
ncbi:hypothetical protein D6833_04180 [Candidatus Parcubacteria bacterium]|nr:MAG: hypothetical protein D6833_04180 [Candidatus Parcubacteria bacterium]